MNKLGIKYLGPVFDGSGYAQFARNFISALHQQEDVKLTVEAISYEKQRPDIGSLGKIIKSLIHSKISYDLKVINILPNGLVKFGEQGKKNISFTMFETTRIPDSWVKDLNDHADAVFVPCDWNVEVFKDSGVHVPIYSVPPGIDTERYKKLEEIPEIKLQNVSKNLFCFYSIFQWTERKNPAGLLKAFWAAFDGVKDVCLILKTYGTDTSIGQQTLIKKNIQELKNSLRLKDPPKIIFVGGLLSNDEITSLHKRGDCFVLPHRAEGFGLPHLEAMACGNPVITTGWSGNMDFCNDDNSYLLPYQMTVVSNMPWIPYYEADMYWAEPDMKALVDSMRHVYNNRDEARGKGKIAKGHVLECFNWETAAKHFVHVCNEVKNG